MLDPALSRRRQQRLLDALRDRKLDAIAIGARHHVYYLTAHLHGWLHQAGFILFSDGRSWLTTANKPSERAAADEIISYESQWMATQRSDQPLIVAQQMAGALKKSGAKKIGIDACAVTSQLAITTDAQCESIDQTLVQLRRPKDSDELALMKTAIRCAEAMYARAREIVAPGVQEIDVFNELHAVAVKTAGEPLTAILGNDFVCGGGGGPPRNNRPAQAGELYILDLGPCYRGYFADNCRTFAVSKELTPAQHEAHRAVVSCFAVIERLARPGTRCRDLYDAVIEHLTQITGGKKFTHHLGHGVGLEPHEYPHLNPMWDDVLEEGEIFAAEPALYAPELRAGLRIENNYLVTAMGVENLLNAPMEMI